MTLLQVPSERDLATKRWINPAFVTYVSQFGPTLEIWMLDDGPTSSRLEATFDTSSQAEAFVKAISLHGTRGGVS